jgi:Domain of unknown function (DUF6542)
MSNPLWRETRQNSPYGGKPGARPRDRNARVPDDDSPVTARDPRWPDQGRGTGEAASRYPDGNGWVPGNPPTRGGDPWADAPTRRLPEQSGATHPSRVPGDAGAERGMRGRGRAAGARRSGEPRGSRGFAGDGGPAGPRLGGTLSGGLGVAIVAASTALGASATMLTGKEPGSILGVFVIVGTVAAAVAVRPQAGRIVIPVPALAYLIAAMVTGVIYDHSADVSKTALAINAAQWIADGFFAMAVATLLAVVLVTGRWILWRRQWPGTPAPQPGLDDYWRPAPYGDAPPASPGGQGPWAGGQRPDQPWPPRPDPRPGRPPGPGPYNFSSGA